jgi:ceroid-lipofuscinosis MFS transporter 7
MQVGITIMIISAVIYYFCSSDPTKSQFIVSFLLMYGFGYPIGHTAVLGAFSKIQKTGRQGSLLGFFATIGSLSRIIMAVLSGYLDTFYDNSPFVVVIVLLGLSMIGLHVYRDMINKYTT